MRGIVDQHVDAAECLHGAVHQRAAMRCLTDIARYQHTCSSLGHNQAARFCGVFMLVQIGYEEVRSFAREGQGHGPPDAGIAAGNQHFLVVQASRAFRAEPL